MLTREEVAMAYRLILGREPESQSVLDDYQRSCHDLTSLREAFINSAEFRSQRLAPRFLPADLGPPLVIDLELTPALLQRMFQRVEDSWQALGKAEPYWSVVSLDQFRSANFPSHAAEFDSTGKRDVDRLLAWLVRNHIDPKAIASCSEYGCGVGRVTTWLASHFPHVCGYDISAPHLQLARQHLSKKGIRNVALLKLDSVASVSALEPADLVFTIIVLQHNPPPVMSHVLRMLLRSLNSGGAAYFQLPTYAVGYHFDVASYFSTSLSPGASFEMHVLPQSTVFEIVEDEGCRVLEVQPDPYVGSADWISNTFLVRKMPRR
jgi:trans-aconitate methyltransferase